MTTQPEPWLRGPVEGFEPLLMPAVHGIVRLTRPATQCPDASSTIPLSSASLSV